MGCYTVEMGRPARKHIDILDRFGVGPGIGTVAAHRWAYQHAYGDLSTDPDLELHHLCNNRRCVNPDHIEQTTHADNVRAISPMRGTCRNGHDWNDANAYFNQQGRRFCRKCLSAAVMRRYRRKQKELGITGRPGYQHRKSPIHCKKGHEKAIHWYNNGQRNICRECGRESKRRRMAGKL